MLEMTVSEAPESPVLEKCEKHLVFVYGTLMRGHYNHAFLSGSRFFGEGTAHGLALYNVTSAFPGAVRRDGCRVMGEVYEVDRETLAMLDRLESNGCLYRREKFPVVLGSGDVVKAWTYLWLRGVNEETFVSADRQPWGKCVV